MQQGLGPVQIGFVHVGEPPFREVVASVMPIDQRGTVGEIPLFNGSLSEVGAWLRQHGYSYRYGTQGVWINA